MRFLGAIFWRFLSEVLTFFRGQNGRFLSVPFKKVLKTRNDALRMAENSIQNQGVTPQPTKRLKQKPSPKHDLTPGPSPMGRGVHASQKTKNLIKTHKKAPPLQRPKPHHLMKCEKGAWRSHVPFSHFGGRGGTSSPHKKNYDLMLLSACSA